MIQFSYIGMEGSTPLLRACFKVVAKKNGDRFCFCSPLKRNTTGWRKKNGGDFAIYYNAPVNWSKAENFIKKAREFDKKLQAPAYKTQIYFCGNLPNAAELLGMEYKADYNGISQD